ncbi:MAG: PD-(D/E)XK nuclease family protein, partial [Deltaproteobacteria bacterium]
HSVERRIIRSLHRSGKAILVFQRDAADWPVLEQMEKELSISIPPDTGSPLTAELRIYGAFDAQSQAACCRQILRDLPMDERTVVVLPDPDALVPLLSETAAFAPELNVSLGYPVKRSPIFSLFELVSKAQLSRKGETYYSRDYLKAISHPLAKNLCQDPSVSRVLVHKVEEMLTGIITCDLSGTLFVDPRAVGSSAELFKEASRTLKNMGTQTSPEELSVILAELHRLLFFNWEKTDSFPDFSAACRDLLMQAVNTSPVESYPLNLMACNAVLDMLPLMENGSFDSERFGGEEIFRIFLSELENRTLSFTGSPLRGLQVLGLFETRSLNFENVVVLDVNEQALPMLRIYEPLIPREVMLALGLNRIEKEDEIQRYQFFRLVRGARRVHLICSSGSDKEKSRFLEELIWERQRVSGSLESGTPAVAFTVKIQPGKKEARKTPEMIKTLAGLTYSSSSLNTYLMCPMRFYYQYMLRLDEKTDLLDETEAKDVGTFCHDLLETAFAPFVGKKPVIDPPFRERFQALFEERFSRVFERTLRPDAFLLKEILKVRLNAFLDKEEGRPVSQIVCLEGKNDETLEIDGKKYSFTWRVDRVDRIDDGSLLVIDYKSGGADLKPASMRTIIARGWERQQLKKTLKSIQLPMYLYFTARRFPGTPVNACLYSLRSSTITTLLKPGALQEEGEVEQVFLSSLGALLGEIVDAQRPFACDDSNPQYCSICPFACLCR